MTFKLQSQVVIYHTSDTPETAQHVVFSRERTLHPGEAIKARGSVATDVEAKGPWVGARVQIRVIDDDTLGVTHKRDLLAMVSREKGYYDDPERIVPGNDPLDLSDPYHSVDKLLEVFNPLEKRRIPKLVRSTFAELGEGTKVMRRETTLRYEPTLSPQERR